MTFLLILILLCHDQNSRMSRHSLYIKSMVHVLPPLTETVLSAGKLMQLSKVYTQLYPNKVIKHVPAFIKVCGRVILAGDIIGSTRPGPNNISSSVVMAFWPGRGDALQSSDECSTMRVGIVNYLFEHSVISR